MTTLIIIICAYIAVNLAMLVFKPVRKSWRYWFHNGFKVLDLWKGLFNPETIGEEKWWKKPFLLLVFIVVSPIYMLCAVLCTLIPYFIYKNALKNYKRQKEIEQIHASLEPPCTVPPPETWGAKSNQKFIHVSLDLPFEPDIHDVIFVENEYNAVINDYILEHYEELLQRFSARGLNLVYLPKLSGEEVSGEALLYMFPYLKHASSLTFDVFPIEMLLQRIISGAIESSALIHRIRNNTDSEYYYYSYITLVDDSPVSISDQIEWYLRHTTLGYGIGLRMCHIESDNVADSCFNDLDTEDTFAKKSSWALEEEIRERIIELRKRGVRLYMLNGFIEEQPTLSRMVITKDYRIILPDYNNTEITMSPLPKAVYLLFLKHPEGILFKHLGDYYEELLDIYKEVGSRVIERNVRKSIHDITDPTSNSINEKCARIREAFLKHFDTPYAQNYYITGLRGEPKKITLPRELVDLQGL